MLQMLPSDGLKELTDAQIDDLALTAINILLYPDKAEAEKFHAKMLSLQGFYITERLDQLWEKIINAMDYMGGET